MRRRFLLTGILLATIMIAGCMDVIYYGGSEPIEPENDTVQEVPEIRAVLAGQERQGIGGSYCWGQDDSAICVDKLPPVQLVDEFLSRGGGSYLVPAAGNIRFVTVDHPDPAMYRYQFLRTDGTVLRSGETRNGSLSYELTPGGEGEERGMYDYILSVSARWEQGDITYFYPIIIEEEPPTPPEPPQE